MSAAELLVTLVVALLVLGPKKLPMLAKHLAQGLVKLNGYKQQAWQLWQTLLNEQRLQENTEKASKADESYIQKKHN